MGTAGWPEHSSFVPSTTIPPHAQIRRDTEEGAEGRSEGTGTYRTKASEIFPINKGMARHYAKAEYSTLWTPELIVVGWLSAGFILMTTALLFYHMTKVSSLEMHPGVAGIFAASLMIASVATTLCAALVYFRRTILLFRKQPQDDPVIRSEATVRFVYAFLFLFVGTIEVFIAFTVLRGALKKKSVAFPDATRDSLPA